MKRKSSETEVRDIRRGN